MDEPFDDTPGGYLGDPAVREFWDRKYAEREQLWSGDPNGALVAEAGAMAPARVLDVGCGEGADAIWLAGRGWEVTALEVSGVALARAAEQAAAAGLGIRFVHAGLAHAQLEPASFDLVSAMYPVLQRTHDGAAERALLGAVAPGGTLLVVHHEGMARREPHGDFDPDDYVWPAMIVELLGEGWRIDLHEIRARVVPGSGIGAHHVDDEVVRATRLC